LYLSPESKAFIKFCNTRTGKHFLGWYSLLYNLEPILLLSKHFHTLKCSCVTHTTPSTLKFPLLSVSHLNHMKACDFGTTSTLSGSFKILKHFSTDFFHSDTRYPFLHICKILIQNHILVLYYIHLLLICRFMCKQDIAHPTEQLHNLLLLPSALTI
jgi:hypothetical protein